MQTERTLTTELIPEEMKKAEMLWWKKVQEDSYSKELNCLNNNATIDNMSTIYQLSPFVDADGIMRMKGRLQYATKFEEEIRFL